MYVLWKGNKRFHKKTILEKYILDQGMEEMFTINTTHAGQFHSIYMHCIALIDVSIFKNHLRPSRPF
jgi:hypothetical protein